MWRLTTRNSWIVWTCKLEGLNQRLVRRQITIIPDIKRRASQFAPCRILPHSSEKYCLRWSVPEAEQQTHGVLCPVAYPNIYIKLHATYTLTVLSIIHNHIYVTFQRKWNVRTIECLTPFFPGIAHSQFIRFIVPSGFFVGTATNPWIKAKQKQKVSISEDMLRTLHAMSNVYTVISLCKTQF